MDKVVGKIHDPSPFRPPRWSAASSPFALQNSRSLVPLKAWAVMGASLMWYDSMVGVVLDGTEY